MNYLVLFGQSETQRYPVIDRGSSNIWESNCCQWIYCLSTSCFLITNWFLFKAVRSVWRGVGRTHTHTHAGCVWLVCVCVWGQALCCVQGRAAALGASLSWGWGGRLLFSDSCWLFPRGPFLTFCWLHGVSVSRHVCHLNQNQNQNLLLLLIIRLTHLLLFKQSVVKNVSNCRW